MWSFWIGAAALAGTAAALMSWAAARAGRGDGAAREGSTDLYTRQLAEVDDLAGRGLLGPEERRAARAEAGRRLLTEAERPPIVWRVGDRSRWLSLAAGGLAALAAAGVYVTVGRPGAPDQPFRTRLEQWRAADPAQLDPNQLVAVLSAAVRERPKDRVGQEFLGRAHLAAGDAPSAVQAFTRAVRLSPNSASLQAELGEAMTLAADGKVTPDAEAAFARAQSLDPGNVAARYFLGRARLDRGDGQGALALWRPLHQSLASEDPRRRALDQEIARAEGRSVAPSARAGLDPQTTALARSMVERLAARLKTRTDDPDGWARLVRSYGVLGDPSGQARALTRARGLFAGRPDALAKVEQAAAPPAAPPG